MSSPMYKTRRCGVALCSHKVKAPLVIPTHRSIVVTVSASDRLETTFPWIRESTRWRRGLQQTWRALSAEVDLSCLRTLQKSTREITWKDKLNTRNGAPG